MDTILIAILTVLIIGISAVIMRDRKKGGCGSCPYNNSCASKENCTESSDR